MEPMDNYLAISFSIALAVIAIFHLLFAYCSGLKKSSPPQNLKSEEEKTCVKSSLPIYNFCSRKVLYYILNNVTLRSEISLSVIVIAYNHEIPFPSMLKECFDYLETRYKSETNFTYEVIIVDNCSDDLTKEVANKYAEVFGAYKCRVLSMHRHKSVVFAVNAGIKCARGKTVLCTDANSTTKFSNITKLEERLQSLVATHPRSFVIGMDAQKQVGRFIYRDYMKGLVSGNFVPLGCGFTLFTIEAAIFLFSIIKGNSLCFDENLRMAANEIPNVIRNEISLD